MAEGGFAEVHATVANRCIRTEATPRTAPSDSTVDAVMARLQATRIFKNHISNLVRDSGDGFAIVGTSRLMPSK